MLLEQSKGVRVLGGCLPPKERPQQQECPTLIAVLWFLQHICESQTVHQGGQKQGKVSVCSNASWAGRAPLGTAQACFSVGCGQTR